MHPALEDLDVAVAAVLAAADDEPDAVIAYELATRAGVIGRELLDASALARGRALDRFEPDALSERADLVALSKTRVAQLIKISRRDDGSSGDR